MDSDFSVYLLEKTLDNPLFEGFGLASRDSIRGVSGT